MDGQVHYICGRKAHRSTPGAVGTLTVVRRSWAYCIAERTDGVHEWAAIAPATVQTLRIALRYHGAAGEAASEPEDTAAVTPAVTQRRSHR